MTRLSPFSHTQVALSSNMNSNNNDDNNNNSSNKSSSSFEVGDLKEALLTAKSISISNLTIEEDNFPPQTQTQTQTQDQARTPPGLPPQRSVRFSPNIILDSKHRVEKDDDTDDNDAAVIKNGSESPPPKPQKGSCLVVKSPALVGTDSPLRIIKSPQSQSQSQSQSPPTLHHNPIGHSARRKQVRRLLLSSSTAAAVSALQSEKKDELLLSKDQKQKQPPSTRRLSASSTSVLLQGSPHHAGPDPPSPDRPLKFL